MPAASEQPPVARAPGLATTDLLALLFLAELLHALLWSAAHPWHATGTGRLVCRNNTIHTLTASSGAATVQIMPADRQHHGKESKRLPGFLLALFLRFTLDGGNSSELSFQAVL